MNPSPSWEAIYVSDLSRHHVDRSRRTALVGQRLNPDGRQDQTNPQRRRGDLRRAVAALRLWCDWALG